MSSNKHSNQPTNLDSLIGGETPAVAVVRQRLFEGVFVTEEVYQAHVAGLLDGSVERR